MRIADYSMHKGNDYSNYSNGQLITFDNVDAAIDHLMSETEKVFRQIFADDHNKYMDVMDKVNRVRETGYFYYDGDLLVKNAKNIGYLIIYDDYYSCRYFFKVITYDVKDKKNK